MEYVMVILCFKPPQKTWVVHGKQNIRVAVEFLQLFQQVPAFHFYSKQKKGEEH